MAITQGGGTMSGYDPSAQVQKDEESAAQAGQLTYDSKDTSPQHSVDNQTLAWNELRRLNRDAETISWTEPGNVIVQKGLTFVVSGWGVADGKYLIDEVRHQVGAGGTGFTTTAKSHKCLIGYGGSGTGTGSSGGAGGGGNDTGSGPLGGNSVPGASTPAAGGSLVNLGPELQGHP